MNNTSVKTEKTVQRKGQTQGEAEGGQKPLLTGSHGNFAGFWRTSEERDHLEELN